MKLKFHKLKAIIILFFFFSLISCQKKIKYHQGLNLVWENDSINWNVSSLMINDGYIYGNSLNDKIFKIRFSDGEIIWERFSQGSYQNLSPLIHENQIFVGGSHEMKSFDLNGKTIWSINTGQKTTGLIIKDSIIFNTRRNKGLFANSILNGNELWSIKPDYQMLSSSEPSLKDSLLIIGNFDYRKNKGDHLMCINIIDKSNKWQIENNGYLNGQAVFSDQNIIYNSDSIYFKGYTQKVDLMTGEILWKTKTNPELSYNPVIKSDLIFVPSYDNGIICLNSETGEPRWKLNKEFYPDTNLIVYNNILYFGTTSREFIGLNFEGKVVFKSKFFYGIGNPFIYKNKLYVADGKNRLFKKTN